MSYTISWFKLLNDNYWLLSDMDKAKFWILRDYFGGDIL